MTSTDDRIATEAAPARDGLSDRVAHLQNAMHRLGADVIRLQTQLSELAAAPEPAPEDDDGGATPFIFNMSRDAYKTELAALVTWVDDFLVPVYVGSGEDSRTAQGGGAAPWCPMWWEHHEAVGRLHALRLAYEELADTRTSGPSGPGVWHRDHLDPALERLRSPAGPFAACSATTGHRGSRTRSQPA
ncbi:DUF4913 domain-containing protein [Streptomonospora litoralis]|uniref:DUF4913 domain-containing protein n=1 Tax=Streptomonospora litoralis TaxID=2498135 RepID=A0A4V0ZK67_9ACTN|nr:DUF4913 domain-containing protein [Streptomonospora litoralis]QBI55922.1 hypothetical protein EKD16_20815 [Streptomonospora litoralis]